MKTELRSQLTWLLAQPHNGLTDEGLGAETPRPLSFRERRIGLSSAGPDLAEGFQKGLTLGRQVRVVAVKRGRPALP